jgi:hypothetical protein
MCLLALRLHTSGSGVFLAGPAALTVSFMNFLPKAKPGSVIHTGGNGRTLALFIAPCGTPRAGLARHSQDTVIRLLPKHLAFQDLEWGGGGGNMPDFQP